MKKVVAVFLMVLLCASMLAIVAFADSNDSPKPDDNHTVDVSGGEGGSASSTSTVVSKDGVTTITAKPQEGYKFTGWTYTGDFEWVKGDANSPEIVIKPLSDVKFVANFEKIGNGGGKKDDDNKSPATGYDMTPVLVVMAAVLSVSAAAAVVTGKRYFASK